MTDQKDRPAAGNGSDQRQFLLQQLYVKDVSFEAPNTPAIFTEPPSGEPDIKLNLKTSHQAVRDGTWEVLVHLSVHAQVEDRSVFLVELDQAGLFMIRGYADEELRRLLGIFCPNTLFPYAREAVSSLVSRGGFPPLILQPINFEALYAQAQARAGAEGQAASPS